MFCQFLSLCQLTCVISDQIFTVAQAVSYLSQGTTLLPGSLIMTGTPAGVGYVRRPRVFLKHGDEVRVWAGSGLGTLVNHVIEEERIDHWAESL
jgi:2-keto-4-pentenoate hydratase/2-oxohepta-3-ene-1,7-dioic acid hydratase in catechol pathway